MGGGGGGLTGFCCSSFHQHFLYQHSKISIASTFKDESEKARVQLFVDPPQWWDKRSDKKNPEFPDFKLKTSNQALWVNDRFSTSWLQTKIAVLPQEFPQKSSPTIQISSSDQPSRTQLWEEFFSDPSEWRDFRNDKRNPRFPDFKHKIANKALWIHNRLNPPWVDARLAAMTQVHERQSGVSTPEISGRLARMEHLWQEFFSDPSQWWDNRLFKKSPKYPDFRHKITHEVLWIEGWLSPPWVKAKMATMLMGQSKTGGGLRTGVPKSFGTVEDVNKLCQEGQLKEAVHIVEILVHRSLQAPIHTYVSLLKECTRRNSLVEGKRVHDLISQSGLDSEIFLNNTLVDMYAKCGSLIDARRVFNTMPEYNVFSWTAIISAYANHGECEKAINLFQNMRQTNVIPDKVTFLVVLKACARISALEQGKQIHSQIIENGFESDLSVGNTIVDMYMKCGCIENACEVFNKMSEHDVVSWNVIISGYAQQGLGKEALDLYEHMKQKDLQPNTATFVVLLKACASIGALEKGKQLHSAIIKHGGFESNVTLWNTLLDMYSKCGCLEDAHEVFNRMTERNVVSWTTILAGYAQQGLGKRALALYEQMKLEGVQPDSVMYVVLLKVCGMMTALDLGKKLHSDMIKSRVVLDVTVGNALVDMYAKCGCIDNAFGVFMEMNERDVVTWNVMIAGYAQQGLGKEAIRLLEQMRKEGMKPDEITYLSAFSACSHSGLVDEGCCLFEFMCNDPDILPTVDHYACMVDLLGRAGCLVDAEDFINKMPIQPDAVVWITLLGAARNHGHVEIGRHAFDHVVKLEPENDAAYVLISNIYAAAGRRDEIMQLKQKMNDAVLEKMSGCSWNKVDT